MTDFNLPTPDRDQRATVSEEFRSWVRERETSLARVFELGDVRQVRDELELTQLELNERVSSLGDAAHAAHRAVVYPRLAPFFLRSPMLRRAHDKPLGHTGDFGVMRRVYRNQPCGVGVDAAVDAYGLSRQISSAVRFRPTVFLDVLERTIVQHGYARVAHIGCGPAWEARELLVQRPDLARQIELVLVDRDDAALAECRRVLVQRGPDAMPVQCLRADVDALLHPDAGVAAVIGRCELVWSGGLFSCIAPEQFQPHLQAMYDLLQPRGRLAVGNVALESPDRWLMEYVTDWFLHHRSLEELERYAEALTPSPRSIRVERDPTGAHLFLTVQRPSAEA